MGNYVNDYQRPGQNSAVNPQRQPPPQQGQQFAPQNQPPQEYQEPYDQGNGDGQKKVPWHMFHFKTPKGSVSFRIWLNPPQKEGGKASFSVSFSKSYWSVKDNAFKDSTSLFPEDLPVVVLGLEECFKIIHYEQAKK